MKQKFFTDIYPRQAEASSFRLGYRPELDGLRGIAILLVLVHHLEVAALPGGYLGVDLFFVLSGFLITTILLEEWAEHGSISLKNFYLRRALRLLPALLLVCASLLIVSPFLLQPERARELFSGALLALSYVSNLIFAFCPSVEVGPLGITWSLAIEEQFYVVWPLLLVLLLRKGVRREWIMGLLALLIAVVAVHREILFAAGAEVRRLYYGTDTRADALLFGCLVSLFFSQGRAGVDRTAGRLIKALSLIGLPPLIYSMIAVTHTDALLYLGGFTVIALLMALVLAALLLGPPRGVLFLLRLKPLVWVGRVSYGLYLWHWPIRELLCPGSINLSHRQAFSVATISLILTALSYYGVEKPFLKLKRRYSVSAPGRE